MARSKTDPFDPYREWLGIPDGARPPDHYTLLGISHLEKDATRIRSAAHERMKRVRANCLKHPAEGTRILNEIAAAQVCLLDPASAEAYRQSLQPATLAQATPACEGGEWRLHRDETTYGPYPFEQLRQFAGQGLIHPTDQIQFVDTKEWQAAKDIKDLFQRNPTPARSVPPPLPGHVAPSSTPDNGNQTWACPWCHQLLRVERGCEGLTVVCPFCRGSLQVPQFDQRANQPTGAQNDTRPGSEFKDLDKDDSPICQPRHLRRQPLRLAQDSLSLGATALLTLCLPCIGWASGFVALFGLIQGINAVSLAMADMEQRKDSALTYAILGCVLNGLVCGLWLLWLMAFLVQLSSIR